MVDASRACELMVIVSALHAHVIISGTLLHNTHLSSKIAAFYGLCGCMHIARRNDSEEFLLVEPMIRGYSSSGLLEEDVGLYRKMLGFGWMADKFSYSLVVKACGDLVCPWLCMGGLGIWGWLGRCLIECLRGI